MDEEKWNKEDGWTGEREQGRAIPLDDVLFWRSFSSTPSPAQTPATPNAANSGAGTLSSAALQGAIPHNAGLHPLKDNGVSFRALCSGAFKLFKYSPHIVFAAGLLSGASDNYYNQVYNPIKAGATFWKAMTSEDPKADPEHPVTMGWPEKIVDDGLTIVGAGYKSIGFVGAFVGDAIADVASGGYYVYKKLSPTPTAVPKPDPNSDPKSDLDQDPASVSPNDWDNKMPLLPFSPTSHRSTPGKNLVQLEDIKAQPPTSDAVSPLRSTPRYNPTKIRDYAVG